jgi:hypothetical protein
VAQFDPKSRESVPAILEFAMLRIQFFISRIISLTSVMIDFLLCAPLRYYPD